MTEKPIVRMPSVYVWISSQQPELSVVSQWNDHCKQATHMHMCAIAQSASSTTEARTPPPQHHSQHPHHPGQLAHPKNYPPPCHEPGCGHCCFTDAHLACSASSKCNLVFSRFVRVRLSTESALMLREAWRQHKRTIASLFQSSVYDL